MRQHGVGVRKGCETQRQICKEVWQRLGGVTEGKRRDGQRGSCFKREGVCLCV